MILQIQDDLKKALCFFMQDDSFKELPFARNFPKNSCEIASAILFLALSDKYSSVQCTRVKGIDPNTSAIHFWVEVECLVLDPTAHQFPQVAAAFAGVQPQFLRNKFSDVLRESKEDVLCALSEIHVSSTQAHTVAVKLFELIRC